MQCYHRMLFSKWCIIVVNLDELLIAIQKAATQAAEVVSASNLALFDRFFEEVPGSKEDIEKITAKAKQAVQIIVDSGDAESAREAIQQAAEALDSAAKVFSERCVTGKLQPKCTTIQYPIETPNGPAIHDVTVPLIAIAPISFSKISEIRFKTDLELSFLDGKLQVSFPKTNVSLPQQTDGSETQDGRTSTKLEIVINEMNTCKGLTIVIEGYERALRAQIPG